MSLLHVVKTFKAVAWSFFGVRAEGEFQTDVSQLKPFTVIAVGIFSAFALVGGLMLLAHWVVAK